MRITHAAILLASSLIITACGGSNAPVKSPLWQNASNDTWLRDHIGLHAQADGDLVFLYQNDDTLYYRRIDNSGALQFQQQYSIGANGVSVAGVHPVAGGGLLVVTHDDALFYFDANDNLVSRYAWFERGYRFVNVLAINDERICLSSGEDDQTHLRCLKPDGTPIWEATLADVEFHNGLFRGGLDAAGNLYTASADGETSLLVQAYSSNGAALWQHAESVAAYPSVQAVAAIGGNLVVGANVRGDDNVIHTLTLGLDAAAGTRTGVSDVTRDVEYLKILPYDQDSYVLLEEALSTGAVTMRRLGTDGHQHWVVKNLAAGGVGAGSSGLTNIEVKLDDAGNIVVLHNVRNLLPALVDGVLGLRVTDNFSLSRYRTNGTLAKKDAISRSTYKVGEYGAITDGEFDFRPYDFVARNGHYYVAAGDIPPGVDPDTVLEGLVPTVLDFAY
ncbi:MAG TPA: hypothetical protein VM553_04100 [Dongiaceae bacterium]|nr:hypothetical protein [Dongiaceae bacterium]